MKLSDIKSNINLKGRAVWSEDNIIMEMTDCAFEFKADFKSDVLLKLTWYGDDGLLGVMIDKDFDNISTILINQGIDTIKVTHNLKGIHAVRIIKLNEYTRNQIEFSEIDFNGEILNKPEENKLKFEFYGDSLSCGYGNLCTSRDKPDPFCPNQHGYKTWCVLLSRELNAEFSICASSGQGILTDCDGNPNGVISKYWDMASKLKNIKWDFKNYIADYVFINIGTNDINYHRNSNTQMDWEKYKKATAELLNGIRKSNPKCTILFALGHDQTNPYYTQMVDAYKQLIKEYDNIYIFSDLSSNQLGGDWHPNVDDHHIIFEKLLKHFIKNFK